MNSQIATFYLLEQDDPAFFITELCGLITDFYSQNQRVFVLARDKAQAEAIDEQLWQQTLERFVPHALVGENKKNAPAIEIGWDGVRHSSIKKVLINLTENVANFAPSFAQVVDFVPCDEKQKQKARDRYRIYSMAGRKIDTLPMPTL